MSVDFNTAEDAITVLRDMIVKLRQIPYNRDLWRLAKNLEDMISDFSSLEVYARRTHRNSRYNIQYREKRKQIKDGLSRLEGFLVLAILMK